MKHQSSTLAVPDSSAVPRHVAIIMDGNGRWATKRFLPRVAGHAKGVDAVRSIVEASAERGIEFLTLFAFSSENWRRPADEVSVLMRLFMTVLEREVGKMANNGIRLKIVGDMSRFDPKLQEMAAKAEAQTAGNSRLTLTVCANYGGRWDVMQAVSRMVKDKPGVSDYTEEELAPYLAMAYAPEPDLFIRTGGEQRISNFLLWQLAYSELYFSALFWPDFKHEAMQYALADFASRQRRFGKTSEQVEAGARV